ncbi:transcriptional regulator [Cupriavidus sp. SK-3]|uniref:transcriptional regulator n=1 Tax=Cupriavidus sp. SK-3 TaxID=1470558 RepID=UPI0009E03079
MDLKIYLRAERGRAARLAEYLGVSAVTVGEWAAQKKAVDARWASLIEGWSAGHVTRECLRPTDWWVIWPELRSRSPAPSGFDFTDLARGLGRAAASRSESGAV